MEIAEYHQSLLYLINSLHTTSILCKQAFIWTCIGLNSTLYPSPRFGWSCTRSSVLITSCAETLKYNWVRFYVMLFPQHDKSPSTPSFCSVNRMRVKRHWSLGGTLVHRRLAPSRRWYSFNYPGKMESWIKFRRKNRSQIFESQLSRDRTGDLVVGKQKLYNCANYARPHLAVWVIIYVIMYDVMLLNCYFSCNIFVEYICIAMMKLFTIKLTVKSYL